MVGWLLGSMMVAIRSVIQIRAQFCGDNTWALCFSAESHL
jgi:hypothetical protein